MTTKGHSPSTEDALRRAKRPANIAAGVYGHPVHPLLVTLPIGAWTASLVLDVASFVFDDDGLGRASAVLVALGLISAVLAAIAGLLDYSRLARGTRARSIATAHMLINVVGMVVFTVSLVIRIVGEGEPSVLATVVSVVGLLLLAVSGFLGGELAYRYGVRVADEETQRVGFEEQSGAAR